MSIDRAREISDDNQINSIFDIEGFSFKCEECGEEFLFKDMRHVHDHMDEGCCNTCSLIPEIAENWGFTNE